VWSNMEPRHSHCICICLHRSKPLNTCHYGSWKGAGKWEKICSTEHMALPCILAILIVNSSAAWACKPCLPTPWGWRRGLFHRTSMTHPMTVTGVVHRAHVDAAYAGATAVLPSMRHWFDGWELVDSFSFNPHKWLLTNFDCAALWVADSGPLKKALSLTPIFLQAKGNALDYKVNHADRHGGSLPQNSLSLIPDMSCEGQHSGHVCQHSEVHYRRVSALAQKMVCILKALHCHSYLPCTCLFAS